ncbi:MAG: inositol monophosphatase, partial [Corynebacterium variabile]|nr:inositol monophosphatase [Corynebacterium variabile]
AVTWVVDPIDGTVNFIYGVPASSVSGAATVNGVPVAGAVADIARHRVFSACVGGPAQVGSESAAGGDGHPRSRILGPVTGPAGLSEALVGTGFSYSSARRAQQAALLVELLPQIRDIRRLGSAALDLCAVAAGALDGFYEHGLGPWDHAAGALIAARAGAQVHMPVLTAGYDDGVGVLAAAASVAGELAGHTVSVRMVDNA